MNRYFIFFAITVMTSCSFNSQEDRFKDKRIVREKNIWKKYSIEVLRDNHTGLEDLRKLSGNPISVKIDKDRLLMIYQYEQAGEMKHVIAIVEGKVTAIGWLSE